MSCMLPLTCTGTMEKSEYATLSQGVDRVPYPKSTIYEIETEDGVRITCQHWKCSGKVEAYPILLLNGYSTESYCLPTEPNDLVRTLLKDGHDIWILHGRVVHYMSNHFTIDDIGTIDIPAAINKMIEFYGASTKVHVVGHCIGGVGIHMALMGGYVSAKHIASLSCTNSSMFFKHTKTILLKLWLPILPMTMALMGKNTILTMLQGSTSSYRHMLVKTLARLMPRYERCSYRYDECTVHTGIFNNPFWHENISESVHHWLYKENHKMLPMAGLPHMGIIAKNGYAVDTKGRNVYLIHPERMAVPTLYVSGGRPLIITPETSLLANEYMKLHQPGYRHKRVVVDGFGHYDLLIGKESDKKVFPYIQEHIKLAEEERSSHPY